jgi:hypothetical protein
MAIHTTNWDPYVQRSLVSITAIEDPYALKQHLPAAWKTKQYINSGFFKATVHLV